MNKFKIFWENVIAKIWYAKEFVEENEDLINDIKIGFRETLSRLKEL